MIGPNEQAKSIFLNALEIASPGERRAYVDSQCGADEGLRGEVEELLLHQAQVGDFLASPPQAIPTIDEPRINEGPGTVIGPYKLLQEIGEGGMGTVFMAEQTHPVQRKVALKVIKPGMDSRQVIARFEAERQALALMDHPNIAKVLDAGAVGVHASACPPSSDAADSDTLKRELQLGRPYFVMELVHGIPITKYCDDNHLTPRERLELFIPVCHAVQQAHQKGIIHRDIKPSNVLVALYDGRPVPKVIDFGVAKATGQKLTERTMFTQFGQIVGTLEYMSPEQADLNQLDIDTRSDIYSLGVLLYELLTGTTPFERKRLREAAFDELLRIIREEEPPKPSTRLSTTDELPSIAANRKTEPRKLSGVVRGELDWIVMKALEKERTRRYETTSDFAADVERYLKDEPVQACPPSASYRFRKFVRRNNAAFFTASAVALAMFMAVATLATSNVRVSRERNQKADALREKEFALRAKDSALQAANREREEADRQRAIAEDQELKSRRQLYVADMSLAHQSIWRIGDAGRARNFLSRHVPRPGQEELRGFEWYYLRRLCQSESRILRAHASEVYSVAFSCDGRRLATAGQDRTVRIWDVPTAKLLSTIGNHSADINWVAFSPDGRRLATASDDRTVKLWDATTGHEQITLNGHADKVVAVLFSPKGDSLASAGDDKVIRMWHAETGQLLSEMSGHTDRVQSLAFSPDGNLLASASSDQSVRVWDLRRSTQRSLLQTSGAALGVAFSHDGQRLAASCDDGTVWLWNVDGSPHLVVRGHFDRVESVSFSRTDTLLASGDGNGIGRIWDVKTGKLRGTLDGHSNRIWCVAFSPKDDTLATSSADHTVKLWDSSATLGYEKLKVLAPNVRALAFAPNEMLVACGLLGSETPGMARVWEAYAGDHLADFHEGIVVRVCRAVAVSATGKFVAAADHERRLRVWEVANRSLLANMELPFEADLLEFSPDGLALAAAGRSVGDDRDAILLCDTRQNQWRIAIKLEQDWISAIAFSPDGKTIATASSDLGDIRTWDATTGEQRCRLGTHRQRADCLAFSPDGKTLASGSRDWTVRLWDVDSEREPAVLPGHGGSIACLAFSPDGRTLASGSEDKTIKLWSVGNVMELFTLEGHSGGVHCLSFAPDGRRLASASHSLEGEVLLWSAAVVATAELPKQKSSVGE